MKYHGEPTLKPRLPIVDELILTVLSQNTSDSNRDRAYASLRERFPTWEQVLDAPVEDVVAAIRAGGIANIKAARIKSILSEVESREGSIDLSRLNKLTDDEVDGYLRSLPGVGPKTVACVLTFAMGRAAFPVDTHVHRVTRRLGWIDAKTSADQAHRVLTPAIPEEIRYELHMLFITHGRTVCKATTPLCSECVLLDLCDAGPRLLSEGIAR
ncbi:MAG: endonuclease III domain-containing protein [Actinomycetota bacterium]